MADHTPTAGSNGAQAGDGASHAAASGAGAAVSAAATTTAAGAGAGAGAGGGAGAEAARATPKAGDAGLKAVGSGIGLGFGVAAAPALPPPATAENNPFNELFEMELRVVGDRLRGMDIDAMLQAGMKAAMGNTAEVKALQQLQVARSTDRHRKLLEHLWTVYDFDRNGILTRAENRRLVTDYLEASRRYTPRVVEATMAAGMQIGLKMASTMAGQDLPADVLSEVNAHVAELRPQILQVALQVLDGVDVAVVADRSLDAMDENQDGKVTRDEFLSLFISVMTEMFDPQLIIGKIQQAMGMEQT